MMDLNLLKLKSKLIGSRFRVQARPGATGCGYDIVIAYYGLGVPSPHLDIPGLGKGFKGYKRGYGFQ